MATTDVDQHEQRTGPGPAEALDRTTMLDIACGIASARELWAQHVRHDELERRPVRLLATPVYEVWVIGWTTGQGVSLHDHGGSSGVLVVTEGRLTERASGAGPRRLEVGDVVEVGPDDVHEVSNVEDEPATSIHLYSPPLAAMGYHLTDDGGPVLLEGLAAREAAVPADAAARVLHPSGWRPADG